MPARIDDLLYLCAGRPAPGGGAAPARDEPAAPALPPRPDRQPGHILVVDDSELNRHLLDRWLRRQGHTAAFAANGAEALARLAAEPFDLVLLDVVMPEMNGYEALRRLKADPRLRHVPVIMISALSEFDRVARCIEIGAEDYLPKPFEPVLLEARIGASLEKKRLRDREIDYLRQIEREKQRYDELLHVMLPGAIVQELKETGTVRSRRYEGVAVLFADIVGFTPFCDAHPPEEVVAHLQALVREFEAICERWGVQKIKTIGDSFMAAAGLLRPVDNPVRACLRCGVEMVAAAERLPPHWRVRVGIHYGPVVAGLLGSRHDLFDLWGDTVNTASRVEQSGEPGAVTLSAAAWEQVAAEAEGEPRGMVHVKGKGEVEMVRFLRFRKGAAG